MTLAGSRRDHWRRAVRRAALGKPALYRGKRITSAPEYQYQPALSAMQHGGQRIEILSWNCSGMTQLLFEELKLYLRLHCSIQVLCLQETHRAFQNEWTSDGWTFIHSAAQKANQGGVLLGFRDGFCDRQSLRWQELHPGRLLHARCYAQEQHLDFVCIYQHALPFDSASLTQTLNKRRQLWTKLDALLRTFPVRSSVILAGDLNSNLCSSGTCVGHSVLHNAAKPAVLEERQWLTGMLVSHQLTALNSWSKKAYTYNHPSGSSQIDWILVRAPLADRRAKRCTPSEAPVAGWRSSGHKVLLASIPLNWRPWRLSRQQARTRSVASSGRHCQGHPQLLALRDEVQGQLVPPCRDVARPKFVGADGEILALWEARRLLARQKIATMRDVFVHQDAPCSATPETT